MTKARDDPPKRLSKRQFAKWVQAHWEDLVRIAQPYAGDALKAEDIVKQAIEEAYPKLYALKKPAKVKSWMSSYVHNVGRNVRRRDQRRKKQPVEDVKCALMETEEYPSPEDLYIQREDDELQEKTMAKLMAEIRRLPKRQTPSGGVPEADRARLMVSQRFGSKLRVGSDTD